MTTSTKKTVTKKTASASATARKGATKKGANPKAGKAIKANTKAGAVNPQVIERKLNTLSGQIDKLFNDMSTHAIKAVDIAQRLGGKLYEAQQEVKKIPDLKWMTWVEQNSSVSYKQASKLIRIHKGWDLLIASDEPTPETINDADSLIAKEKKKAGSADGRADGGGQNKKSDSEKLCGMAHRMQDFIGGMDDISPEAIDAMNQLMTAFQSTLNTIEHNNKAA